MDRIKAFFVPAKASADEYEPLADDESGTLPGSTYEEGAPFSWIEYSIFALIGVAMLWAWNMFLAAAPYFQTRFQSDSWIFDNSQSAILTTFTAVSLVTMLILSNIQSSANYPFRISTALLISAAVFVLLTISTSVFLDASPRAYFAFLLLMVALTAWAAGLMQNGAFSFAASFGRPEYTQAIMAGQGVAGILPPLAQMLSFLAFSDSSPEVPPHEQPSGERHSSSPSFLPPANKDGHAAFIYFLTAVLISLVTMLAFIPLVRRHSHISRRLLGSQQQQEQQRGQRRYVPLSTLLRKLRWLAGSVFVCFVIAMFYPVFTAKILSVHSSPSSSAGKIFTPGAFIPLAFFFWNLGDLLGRVSTMMPSLSLRHRPRALFAISLARCGFLPLYLLCNLHGEGAVVESDLFYLLLVQFPFGLTNGWLGSSSMMAAGEWVDEEEREAAGGFMGLCLIAGLAAGSVLSFSAAGI
ncbi:nucleoside transporter FUN26 [Achaetomium macrosporum]|uniref:Nucleoside transporter FUN26 n=1 Tax=Achaetomium macrosporum TaxID=79813 RepID=A0AAN7HGQ2_9PEZI|nr:nucleoside transporter FUN26 [Achaetomium macrosporum]